VPSLPLSQCFARLLERTAEERKNQSTQEDKQNCFTDKKISFFHHFFPFRNLKSRLNFPDNRFCTGQPAHFLLGQHKTHRYLLDYYSSYLHGCQLKKLPF
jgi:hypothetical protein